MPGPSAACLASSSKDSTSVYDRLFYVIVEGIYDAQMESVTSSATCNQEKFSVAQTAARLYMSSLGLVATALCVILMYQLLTYPNRPPIAVDRSAADPNQPALSGTGQARCPPAMTPLLEASTSDDSVMAPMVSVSPSSIESCVTWPPANPQAYALWDKAAGGSMPALDRRPRSRRIRQVTMQ